MSNKAKLGWLIDFNVKNWPVEDISNPFEDAAIYAALVNQHRTLNQEVESIKTDGRDSATGSSTSTTPDADDDSVVSSTLNTPEPDVFLLCMRIKLQLP